MTSINICDWVSLGHKILSALDSGKHDGVTAASVQDKIRRGEIVGYLKEVLGPHALGVFDLKEEAILELKETFVRCEGEIPVQNSGLGWLLWVVLSEIMTLSEKRREPSLKKNDPIIMH